MWDLGPYWAFVQKVKTDNQDEPVPSRFQRFSRWALREEWDNLICQQRGGISNRRASQPQTYLLYRGRSGLWKDGSSTSLDS